MPIKLISYDVELKSVNPVRSFDRQKVYTNDLNSVEIKFHVTDMSEAELTGATAITMLYMRDGSFFQNPATDVALSGTTFSYTLKENEGNHAGVTRIQLIVTIGTAQFATQAYEFEVINGLDIMVAQEIMIHDWTSLTTEARVFIDTATLAEQERVDAEIARAAQASSDHTAAETDHETAVSDHTIAVSDHTLAAADHTTAAADHNIGTVQVADAQEASMTAQQALSDYLALFGTAGGTATLGMDGKLSPSQIPAISINDTFPVADTTAMLALTAQRGDVAIIVVADVVTDTYMLMGDDPSVLANWKKLGVSYVAEAGHAQTATAAEDSQMINGHRIVAMTQAQYDVAVKDPDTIYVVG